MLQNQCVICINTVSVNTKADIGRASVIRKGSHHRNQKSHPMDHIYQVDINSLNFWEMKKENAQMGKQHTSSDQAEAVS